jgi:Leucine-rich repeat (LRR) protein
MDKYINVNADILNSICIFLPVNDLLNLSVACKLFFRIINDSQNWKLLLDMYYKNNENYESLEKFGVATYKELFKIYYVITKFKKWSSYNESIINLYFFTKYTVIRTVEDYDYGSIIQLPIHEHHPNNWYKATPLTGFPKCITFMPNLTRLNLSCIKIDEIPSTIDNLINLTNLYLNNNKISSVPVSFGKLINLQVLHLNNNELINIPMKYINY